MATVFQRKRFNLRCGSGLTLAVVLTACGPTLSVETGGSTGDASTGEGSNSASSATSAIPSTGGPTGAVTTSSATTDNPTLPVTTATVTTMPDSTGSETSGSTTDMTGNDFILTPDGGGGSIECSQWDQDCPPGQKCTAWANDGGNAWNATKCVPVVGDPDAVGEPCTVMGSGVSGIDTCDVGAMCWDVDSKTNSGTCRAFCSGSESNPQCAPDHYCTLTAEGVLTICIPNCDPLAQDCGEGQGCYGISDTFVCAPDASGKDGNFGESCEFINGCTAGLICGPQGSVPGCEDGGGCCTSYCDTTEATPCPDGLECEPYYAPGQAPPNYENVGICTAL